MRLLVLLVVARRDGREPHDARAHLERDIDRRRVQPADHRVEGDAAEDLRLDLRQLRRHRANVHDRRVVMRFHDDRANAGGLGLARGLDVVHLPRERRWTRVAVHVDRALEDAVERARRAHAGTGAATPRAVAMSWVEVTTPWKRSTLASTASCAAWSVSDTHSAGTSTS